jgi:hypothetical protein
MNDALTLATSHCRSVIKTATDMLAALQTLSTLDAVSVVPIVSVDEPRILITCNPGLTTLQVKDLAGLVASGLVNIKEEGIAAWTKEDISGSWQLSRRFVIEGTTIVVVIHTQLPSRVLAKNL